MNLVTSNKIWTNRIFLLKKNIFRMIKNQIIMTYFLDEIRDN